MKKRNPYIVLVACMSLLLAESAEAKPQIEPLVRVVDLKVGESQLVELCDGSKATVKLLDLKEKRDNIRGAVRVAQVKVEVNGKPITLNSATYHLPVTIAGVRIDCSITKGYNSNGSPKAWALDKDARLRLWPAGSPLLRPGTFVYPVKQRWFASMTQMCNVPTYVNGCEQPLKKPIYYHNGLDIGGCESLIEVVSATDGLVIASGLNVLDRFVERIYNPHSTTDINVLRSEQSVPLRPRYDNVYLLDARGWCIVYSHLKEIDEAIKPGRIVNMGDRIGTVGKEGGSGGWSHLHFGIKARQPSGRWGEQEGYAFLWEAYRQQYKPKVIAVARPHRLILAGEQATLDGSKSWSATGKIDKFEWQLSDATAATGARITHAYPKPGCYSEVLKVTDAEGNIDYDFGIVQVLDGDHLDRLPPMIHPTYAPTQGIRVGDPVTFKVRTFGTTDGKETWDFGDGSPPVKVQSDGNVDSLAEGGYAVTTHRFEKPGHYVVRVERTNDDGVGTIGHLHVRVGVRLPADKADVVQMAKQYLTSTSDKRADSEKALRDYHGPIETVIAKLIDSEEKQWTSKAGTLIAEHFTAPGLREKYQDDLLYFFVPEEYDPKKPFGLLIFMHGGGPGTTREYARHVVSKPEEDKYSYSLRSTIEHAPFITVAPSAPLNKTSAFRWNLWEADEYIGAVIRECHYRFHIDRDRVFLGGQSMGGFGAYHLCQRLADRIAGGVLFSGAWNVCHWKNVIGTPLFIRHGANDAIAPGTPHQRARPRFTDLFYARSAHQFLKAAGAEHVYAEDSGGHPISEAGESLKKLVPWMKEQRRDPFAARVVAVTPRGWDAREDTPTPHHRWITIHEIGDGSIPFDEIKRTGPSPEWKESREAFDRQGFELTKRDMPAGLVDATNHGDNRMSISTQNVKRFSIWLHPQMVDFTKPLRVTINGYESQHTLKRSLLDALRSYERRHDWGLVYHSELPFDSDAILN